MKRLSIFFSFIVGLIAISSCDPSEPIFVSNPSDSTSVEILNSLQGVYRLSESTADNIAERFVWEEPDFGVQQSITYELRGSIDATFTAFTVVGSTNENNLAITVGQLLDFAEDLGLDDDPATTDTDGNPNNTGSVFVNVRAYTGTGGTGSQEVFSDTLLMPIEWIEQVATGAGCDPIYVVGAGAADAGWDWSTPVVLECNEDVYSTKIRLVNDAFRFFTVEGDWASGLNYPYYAGEGYTIDAQLEDALDGDNNFRFVGTPGIYTLTVDDNAQTITLEASTPLYLVGDATQAGWSWDNPVLAEEVEVGVYEASVDFTGSGAFRFFTVRDDWGSGLNYPYYEGEGYTIDARFENANDGDSNFSWTGGAGTFTVRVDTNNQTITVTP